MRDEYMILSKAELQKRTLTIVFNEEYSDFHARELNSTSVKQADYTASGYF
jgi:hypothetical protein